MRASADQPSRVVWETTRACDLDCRHCPAGACPRRSGEELSTLEAMAFMNRVRRFGRARLVLTGGDPARRYDLVDLVAHGARLGLRMGIIPSATPLMTPDLIRELADAGLEDLTARLDGGTPEEHDRFRGVEGSWERTQLILRAAADAGLDTHILHRSEAQEAGDLFIDHAGEIRRSRLHRATAGNVRTEELPESIP